jgi:hypothetical protein
MVEAKTMTRPMRINIGKTSEVNVPAAGRAAGELRST